MYCIRCGRYLKDGTKYCIYCGAPTTGAQPDRQDEWNMVAAEKDHTKDDDLFDIKIPDNFIGGGQEMPPVSNVNLSASPLLTPHEIEDESYTQAVSYQDIKKQMQEPTMPTPQEIEDKSYTQAVSHAEITASIRAAEEAAEQQLLEQTGSLPQQDTDSLPPLGDTMQLGTEPSISEECADDMEEMIPEESAVVIEERIPEEESPIVEEAETTVEEIIAEEITPPEVEEISYEETPSAFLQDTAEESTPTAEEAEPEQAVPSDGGVYSEPALEAVIEEHNTEETTQEDTQEELPENQRFNPESIPDIPIPIEFRKAGELPPLKAAPAQTEQPLPVAEYEDEIPPKSVPDVQEDEEEDHTIIGFKGLFMVALTVIVFFGLAISLFIMALRGDMIRIPDEGSGSAQTEVGFWNAETE